MTKSRSELKGKSQAPQEDSKEPKMDIKSILKDIEILGSTHMTWKQKKDLENKKVVSLGGKPLKKQRLPLSVARATMKKQKEMEEKMLKERELLGRFGAYSGSRPRKVERRRPEERILKSTEGNFRNGILDVKHLLQPTAPRVANDHSRHGTFSKGKKNKGGKKGHNKKKGFGNKKRH
ncbi:uncharacterized protein LOC127250631 [Andrographis paniculata]|uniref:uncharacterized protein LOC127250631 n=1 Tax=Andrographis paniculata TaxID=175694 RepID=UPI0021E77C4B|nr:uncharacterized protein LOC127250631 [Andrographis paniculata]XP_051129973.1 uncharacterized protein LOC127250631 [Andrographis paniculata]